MTASTAQRFAIASLLVLLVATALWETRLPFTSIVFSLTTPLLLLWVRGARGVPLVAWCLVLVVCGLSLVPLPLSLLGTLSPRAAELRASLGQTVGVTTLCTYETVRGLLLLAPVALAYFAAAELDDDGAERLWTALLWLSGIVAVWTVADGLSHIAKPQHTYGPFHHRNRMGTFLGMASCFGIAEVVRRLARREYWAALRHPVHRYDLFRSRSFGAALALALGTLVVVAASLRSVSRAAALGLFLGILVAAVLSRAPGRMRLWFAAGGTLALVAVAVGSNPSALYDKFVRVGLTGRLVIWSTSVDILKAFPLLGSGLGTFGEVYPGYESKALVGRVAHAENDLLQMLVELGVIAGGAFILALLWPLARTLWQGERAPGSPLRRLGLLAASCAAFVPMMVESQLPSPLVMVTLSLSLGLLNRSPEVTGVTPRPARWVPRAALAAIGVVVIAATAKEGRAAARLDPSPQVERTRVTLSASPNAQEQALSAALELARAEPAVGLHRLRLAHLAGLQAYDGRAPSVDPGLQLRLGERLVGQHREAVRYAETVRSFLRLPEAP